MIVLGGERILTSCRPCTATCSPAGRGCSGARLGLHAGARRCRKPMTPDEYCQQKAAASGSSFYYSFLFLPPERRRAITALYAFCREVDDVVDEVSDPGVARTKLAWWRQEIGAIYAGTPQHPVAQALAPVVRAYESGARRASRRSSTAWRWISTTTAIPTSPPCRSTATAWRAWSGELSARDLRLHRPAHAGVRENAGTRLPAHQHHSRRRRGRAPQPHLPAARRVGALRPHRRRPDRAQGRRTVRAAHGVPDRARPRATTTRALALLPASDRKSQRAGLVMAAIYRTLLEEIARPAAACSTSASR